MSSLARYFHTLRYLRPVQIAGRVRRQIYRPKPDLTPAPARRDWGGPWVQPVPQATSMVGPERFRFLGVVADCASAAEWNDAARAALWIYNLHYFDDLNAECAEERAGWHDALVNRWIAENPPGRGKGWDAYPLSRRLVNWIKWSKRRRSVPQGFDDSLAAQTRWLRNRLEYHLLGNHLLANAKALVFAGLYFEGPEAEEWLRSGLRVLAEELEEQILADGAHFELSTMYHAATLEDVLDVVNVTRAAGRHPPAAWIEIARRMQRWLDLMTHDDGEISFFNDAALGIAPTAAQLRAYAGRLGQSIPEAGAGPIEWLAESGYARLTGERLQVLADAGAIGPDYLPAHAHADTFSFEADIDGRRVLVNSGTSEYGVSAERNRQRGTAAHNTVVVDGADSSEVWAGFRVARRARVRMTSVRCDPSSVLEAEHDGYLRLPGRNLHRRRWTLSADALDIEDEVTGSFNTAEAYFHLHPLVQASQPVSGIVGLELPGGVRARLEFEGAASVNLRAGSWHPRFGEVVPNQHVMTRFANNCLRTRLVVD